MTKILLSIAVSDAMTADDTRAVAQRLEDHLRRHVRKVSAGSLIVGKHTIQRTDGRRQANAVCVAKK